MYHNNIVSDSEYISVMTGTVVFWCGLLQESESTGRQQEQKQSPKETGMCVCREGTGCGWMCIRVYV